MKKHIPNAITLLNVLSGCIAILFAVKGQLQWAAIFVFIGIVFDFFDGLAARLLHVKSELGVQLDSLADMITSGVVPGIVMFQLFNMSIEDSYVSWNTLDTGEHNFYSFISLSLAGFLITLAAAYRLAKFNIDENQVDTFIGLPTPANALFVVSLPLILYYHTNDAVHTIILNKWFLLVITLLLSFLMNAKITLFSLKFKDMSFKNNALRYTYILMSLILLITMKFIAIPIIILLYVVFSMAGARVFKTTELS